MSWSDCRIYSKQRNISISSLFNFGMSKYQNNNNKKSVGFILCLFHMNMLKGTLQSWSVYPQWAESTFRPIWQPLRSMQAGTHLTQKEGKLSELQRESGTEGHTEFNPQLGRELNMGPSGWEAEILPLSQPLRINVSWSKKISKKEYQ